MGLDMYLSKKTYVKNWDFQTPEEQHKITVKKGGKLRKDIKPERITYIVEQVGYWRKFNALHNWFVDNVQDGEDDCREHYVDKSKIKELIDVLKKVKESLDKSPKVVKKVEMGWTNGEKEYGDWEVYEDTSVVEELLPPSRGFFFGSYEVDKYYYEDVCSTLEIFEELLKEGETVSDYYYQASW